MTRREKLLARLQRCRKNQIKVNEQWRSKNAQLVFDRDRELRVLFDEDMLICKKLTQAEEDNHG